MLWQSEIFTDWTSGQLLLLTIDHDGLSIVGWIAAHALVQHTYTILSLACDVQLFSGNQR